MDDHRLEIEPPRANLGQLRLTNKLEMVPVHDDVLGVIERLQRIDRGLKMFYDINQEIFVLYHEGLNEQGHLVESFVGAYRELDQRVVNLIERIDSQGRGRQDLATELGRLEAEKDAENARDRLERVGPMAEKLQHAIRRDLGMKSRAFMSGKRKR